MNSQNSFNFIFHFLVSGNPHDWDKCHHTDPSQGKVKCIVEFQQRCEHADEKSRQVGETKGKEPSCDWDIFLDNC